MKKWILSIALIATFVAAGPSAQAGNAKSFPMGDNAALTAQSNAAITRDSEGIWYNPAGLGGNQYSKVNLSGNVFMVRFQNIPAGQEAVLPSGTQGTDLKGNEFLAVPAAMTFMGKFTDRLGYGFGVYVPQNQDVIFDSSLQATEQFPTIAEPVVYTQGMSVDSLNLQYQVGGALGYEVTDDFRVGGGVFVIYDRFRQNASLYEDIESADNSLATSLVYIENSRYYVRTIGVRGTAALQWDISPEWRLGLLAESPMFQIYSWGDATSSISIPWVNQAGQQVQVADRTSISIHEFEGDMVEPFHTQLSFAFVRPAFWIGLAADIYLPLKQPTYRIDKKFNWNVSVGSKIKLSEKFYLGAGFFTDMSDQRDPQQFGDAKVDYYGVTAGVDFRTPVAREDDPAKAPIIFSTTLAGRYAYGIGQAGGISLNPLVGNITDAPSRAYDVRFQEVSVYLGTGLSF